MNSYQQGDGNAWDFEGDYYGLTTPAQRAAERYLASIEAPDPVKAAAIAEGKRKLAKSIALPILLSLVMGA